MVERVISGKQVAVCRRRSRAGAAQGAPALAMESCWRQKAVARFRGSLWLRRIAADDQYATDIAAGFCPGFVLHSLSRWCGQTTSLPAETLVWLS